VDGGTRKEVAEGRLEGAGDDFGNAAVAGGDLCLSRSAETLAISRKSASSLALRRLIVL
jgi:hypothetical protein